MTIRVADEVWIAAALLQRERPDQEDFSVGEIVARAERENVTGTGQLRPSVRVHAAQHCVANKRPNPGRYRMLFETGRGRRRLFRADDPYHPERKSGKVVPNDGDIPEPYRELLDWYEAEYAGSEEAGKVDPILALRGLGQEIWVGEPSDAYVRRLREGWE